jgi:hypothetical protein
MYNAAISHQEIAHLCEEVSTITEQLEYAQISDGNEFLLGFESMCPLDESGDTMTSPREDAFLSELAMYTLVDEYLFAFDNIGELGDLIYLDDIVIELGRDISLSYPLVDTPTSDEIVFGFEDVDLLTGEIYWPVSDGNSEEDSSARPSDNVEFIQYRHCGINDGPAIIDWQVQICVMPPTSDFILS